MSKRRLLVALAAIVVIAVVLLVLPRKSVERITIGTGSVTGVYYPAGGHMAALVNAREAEHGIRMSVQATGGSVFNINAVLAGDMEFGIAQSDRQYQALRGLAEWQQRGPQAALRSICSLHPELVTLVAADDAGINALADLKGKAVNIGNPGSGQRGNAIDVLTAAGIDWQADISAQGVKAAEQDAVLQDGLIDAFFYTVGHPSGAITQAFAGQRRKVHFVPITGMDALCERSPYYTPGAIPAALYAGDQADDVPTIGVMTTVVTSAEVPEHVVHAVTRELFENLEAFKEKHPAFQRLDPKEMVTRGLFAPIHPGAMRYYKEAGLME